MRLGTWDLKPHVNWLLINVVPGGEYGGRLKPVIAIVVGDEAVDCALRPFPTLRLKSWDLASMLGLVIVSKTWELGPHVKRLLRAKFHVPVLGRFFQNKWVGR